MFWKRTFLHVQFANTATWQCSPDVDLIMQLKVKAAWWQKGSEPWEHWAAYDLKWNFQRKTDRKCTFDAYEETEKWIEDYGERETAVERKGVQDAETGIVHKLQHMSTAENAEATTSMLDTTFEEMLNATGDSLSNLASSDIQQSGEDEEDDEEDLELGKLSDDDETGLVMGMIPKRV